MTTFVSTHPRGNDWNVTYTNAAFQTWVAYVKAALDGVGLVQTSDTGQLDPATVTFPINNFTDSAGYLMYRFADSLQGTDPVFIRITVGRGGSSTASRLRIQVGQGSDGSGTLTGTVSTVLTCGDTYAIITTGDTPTTDYCLHADGVASIILQADPVGPYNYPPRHYFIISRTRNQSTGAFDGRGVVILSNPGDPALRSGYVFLSWQFGQQHAATVSRNFCLIPSGLQYEDDGVTKIAWPHFYQDDGVVKQMWTTWTTHADNLATGAVTFTAAPYGVSRTWLAIGPASRGVRGTGANQSTFAMVFLWE